MKRGSRRPPLQGDAELFREFNAELIRKVNAAVRTSSSETVEDACAFAWARFIECQPDRDAGWRGWLVTVAKRQAWVIEGQSYEAGSRDPETLVAPDIAVVQGDLDEAWAVLRRLPARQRRALGLRALGLRHSDIAEITGDSRTRVAHLIANANALVADIRAEDRETREEMSPRARRLLSLEREPPEWLVEAIGKSPLVRKRNVATATRMRAWRRAALAVDDYRIATRENLDRDLSRLRALAARAIDAFNRQRDRSVDRGLGDD